MAVITPQEISRSSNGTLVTLAAASSGGDTFVNGTKRSLRVKNAAGGNLTLTVAIPGTTDAVANADKVYTIPNDSAIYEFSPFPVAIYSSTVTITYSSETSITVAVVYHESD